MAYDPVRRRLVVFGGTDGSVTNPMCLADTWEWDGVAWSQRLGVAPPVRIGAGLAFDEALQQTVLFGGTDRFRGAPAVPVLPA